MVAVMPGDDGDAHLQTHIQTHIHPRTLSHPPTPTHTHTHTLTLTLTVTLGLIVPSPKNSNYLTRGTPYVHLVLWWV